MLCNDVSEVLFASTATSDLVEPRFEPLGSEIAFGMQQVPMLRSADVADSGNNVWLRPTA